MQAIQSEYTYRATYASATRANWQIDDLIGGGKELDFSRPFMPETLARTAALDFLNDEERLTVNQIRGYGYLHMFGLVEEFILPFVMDHTRGQLDQDDYQIRALLQFAGEEAKHIHQYRRFKAEFTRGFGTPVQSIGPAEDVAKFVLSHDPLAVGLVILMIEWMTQAHYVESVKDNAGLDPMFSDLLRHHWMEEASHAKLDTLMVMELAKGRDEASIDKAVDDFMKIGGFVDEGLKTQVGFDIEAFERATGFVMSETQRQVFSEVQHQANRYTFLGSGMMHPRFIATLTALGGTARSRIAEVTPVFA